MKRIVCLMLCLVLCAAGPLPALGASMTLELTAEGVRYSFRSGEEFVLIKYATSMEGGQRVVCGEDGVYEGVIPLRWTDCGGKCTVTVESLKNRELIKQTVSVPRADDYAEPRGKSSQKVSDFVLTETVSGFDWSFTSAGSDYKILSFKNKQEKGTVTVYPVDDKGHFAGSVDLPLTYARTLTTVQVMSGSKTVLKEDTVRKAYEAPAPVPVQPGRLTGLTVCIDPGHQENGHPVREPIGPGLEGSTAGTSGMAQGTITMRKESIVVLEIAMLLRDELLRQGASVVMTREAQDVFHTNRERCDIAEEAGAFIMLRLHCDTVANASKSGISIWAPLHSDYARAVADSAGYRAIGDLMLNAVKTAVGYPLTDATGTVHLSDNYVGNNWAKMICLLIEMGYMSNTRDDYLLSCPVYQQRLAQGMAQGVYEIAVHRGLIGEE